MPDSRATGALAVRRRRVWNPVALSVFHPLFVEVAAGIEIVVNGSHEKLAGDGQIATRWRP